MVTIAFHDAMHTKIFKNKHVCEIGVSFECLAQEFELHIQH